MNLVVHSVMYSYFAICALKIRLPNACRPFITTLQQAAQDQEGRVDNNAIRSNQTSTREEGAHHQITQRFKRNELRKGREGKRGRQRNKSERKRVDGRQRGKAATSPESRCYPQFCSAYLPRSKVCLV